VEKKKAKVTKISEINRALAKGRAETADTIIAISVQYSPKFDIYILGMGNGTRTILARENLQGLRDASPAQLKRVELLGWGTGLYWPDLDVELYVPALVEGIYGSRGWMKEVGRRGGIVKSPVKTEAARKNGLRGGRPRKMRTDEHPGSEPIKRSNLSPSF
jgi:hypothetical protein